MQILLSTYNGERYLEEQIDSLLNQDFFNISIFIRDDGSTDSTVDLLKKYENQKRIKILYGKNKGVIESFFELIRRSDNDCDFISFCDQDDVWEQDKISRAVSILSEFGKEIPLMYCSRLKIVDDTLKFIKFSAIPPKGPLFGNSLVENIATGCSVVINKSAITLLSREFPQNVLMHDWWMYQVVSGVGHVVYDDQSRILYRQHSNNIVGIRTNIISQIKIRMKRFIKNGPKKMERGQEKELYRIFGNDLSKEKSELLYSFIHRPKDFFSRWQYACRTKVFRQKKIDDLFLKILMAANKF